MVSGGIGAMPDRASALPRQSASDLRKPARIA
jgi:hypothetical protein